MKKICLICIHAMAAIPDITTAIVIIYVLQHHNVG